MKPSKTRPQKKEGALVGALKPSKTRPQKKEGALVVALKPSNTGLLRRGPGGSFGCLTP